MRIGSTCCGKSHYTLPSASGDLQPLAVFPTPGGQQLFNPVTGAEYAIDAEGFYVDAIGNRLTVDVGYAVGDQVGPFEPWGELDSGAPAVVVNGQPALERANGFNNFSDTDYLAVPLADVSTSHLFSWTSGTLPDPLGTYRLLASSGTTGFSSFLYRLRWLVRTTIAGVNQAQAVSGVPLFNPFTLYGAGTTVSQDNPGSTVEVTTWDQTGTQITNGSNSDISGLSLADTYLIGRASFGTSNPWNTTEAGIVHGVLIWADSTRTAAQLKAVNDQLVAGVPVFDVVQDATYYIAGIISGAIDNTNLLSLPYIGAIGDGTPVVVARPLFPPTPIVVPDPLHRWNGLTSATYNGSNRLTAIADTGTDGTATAVPDGTPAVPQAAYTIDGVPSILPGIPPTVSPTAFAEAPIGPYALTDFTLALLVPSRSWGSANTVYFGLDNGGVSVIQVRQGSTPPQMAIASSTGTDAQIPIGMQSGTDTVAILIIRRTAGNVIMDAWYDNGLGTVKSPQVVAPTTIPSPVTVSGASMSGRGNSITFVWNGGPFFEADFHQVALDDFQTVRLAQQLGATVGISGIV